MVAGAGEVVRGDMEIYWRRVLNCGQVEKPEYAYVPVEEKYDMLDSKNTIREFFGRHRCLACGKSFFFRESAFNCHPEASAYEVWNRFAHQGQAGARSLADAVRAGVSNPYGGFGSGPYGL